MCFVSVEWWLESHVFCFCRVEIFGGKCPQGSIKNFDLWDFFWGGTPKIVSNTRILWEIFGGKYPQGSIKNWDLWDFFGGRDPQDKFKHWDLLRNFWREEPPR